MLFFCSHSTMIPLQCLSTPQLAQSFPKKGSQRLISILPSFSQNLHFPGSFATRWGHVTKWPEKEQTFPGPFHLNATCGEQSWIICLKDRGSTKQKFLCPWHWDYHPNSDSCVHLLYEKGISLAWTLVLKKQKTVDT